MDEGRVTHVLSMDNGKIRTQNIRTSSTHFNLAELPDDVLFSIFQRCDIETLGRLCRVCHKLNTLIQFESVWLAHRNSTTLVGSCTESTCIKSNREWNSPGLKEQLRLSNNWVDMKYKETVLCRLHSRQLPWLQFSGNTLWISKKNVIKSYRKQRNGALQEDCKRQMTVGNNRHRRSQHNALVRRNQSVSLTNEDVSRFVVKDNVAVSGYRDGSIHVFDCDNGKCLQAMYKIHQSDTQSVDFHGTCIVSGSRDKTVKIMSMNQGDKDNRGVSATIDMHDRVWSVSVSPEGQCFAVGTSGCNVDPLSLWDVERVECLYCLGSYRYGAGVLDMKFEDSNTLVTCGYDACLRLWDLRTGRCVDERHEPYDTTLYCLQTDRNVTMVTGTARYGMVRLWDKRKPESIQKCYLSQKSPVYSLAFDWSHLYAGLDLSINMLDFTIYPT